MNKEIYSQKNIFEQKSSSNRYCFLDLLRFIATLAILFWHYSHFFFDAPGKISSSFVVQKLPFYDFFAIFYRKGYLGVQLFWALSGFVFFALFADKVKNIKISAKVFFGDRFSRLYPLHFLSLMLVLFLVLILQSALGHSGIYPFNDTYHFFLNLFCVPYLFPHDGWSFNAPVWSVTIEILIYIIFFIYARYSKVNIMSCLCIAFLLLI